MLTDFKAAREGRVKARGLGVHPVVDSAACNADFLGHVLDAQYP